MNLNRKWENKVDGYGFTMRTEIGAAIGKADRVRLDWKQGRKLLASARCELDAYDDQYGNVRCEYADKPLTAKGAIKADLVYSDDVDGNDYLLRTFKLVVAKYPSFGDAVWQLVPDDLLGAAWVEHNYPQQLNDATRGHPHFIFWVANKLPGDGALRCTVAGSKIPDIKLAMDVAGNINIGATTSSRNGKRLEYRWTHVDATADIYFGKRADYKGASDQMAFLAEHPGAWDCQVRSEGTAIRQLLFTVGNDGLITSDLQTARGAALTAENVSAIDLRFPRGVKFDERVRPGAMKTSRGFGLPWPDARSVKASQATFPPASGLPDPK
jgi:hypothetical protein